MSCHDPHCCPGARDLTVVWGCNRGGGSPPGLTRNLGGDLAQPRRPGHGILRPTPRRPPWVSHDGTGRAPPGGGGMQVSPGSPCGPALSRACVSLPTVLPPTTPCVSAQVRHGWGPHTRTPGRVWGCNTMAFGQGTDVTGGYRFCPAMQCGTTVTSVLTTTYPVTTVGQPRWHRAGSTGGWRYASEPRVSLWPSPLQGTCAPLFCAPNRDTVCLCTGPSRAGTADGNAQPWATTRKWRSETGGGSRAYRYGAHCAGARVPSSGFGCALK